MVNQYKMSVIQMYQMERRRTFIFGEQQSEADLYTEPVIIQRHADLSVLETEVRVDHFFGDQFIPRSVILQGSSGMGKSFIAQKIMFDWASEIHPAKFNLVFYLRCEELMCFTEDMSLIDLLSWSSSLTSDQISQMLQRFSSEVLFIIDGFDELRLTRDISYTIQPTDPYQKTSPKVSLCALLKGQILPDSFLLVTTRSTATKTLSNLLRKPQCFKYTIMGFSEKRVEEYFQKFFQDEELFRKTYESVKANETLFTACLIPVICWIICTVIRERFSRGADVTGDLKTITSIYVDFVFTVLEHHCQGLSESVPTLLRSLGQLAERGMIENKVLLDEKPINKPVQDPVNNPFLNKFLLEKTVQQKTMFRFTHFSFQEFFPALYYILLDDEESQKKVRELLHTVERGCALSCSSVTDFSNRDSKIRAKQFLPVILFLCGLCKNESIISFFEKHNVAVSINIETQLKEWINQCSQRCSQRYQQENMLFILHCLYELHDKSFTGKVLEALNQINLSYISLNSTDCCVLRFCLQCCKYIRNLRLNVTSDHLKILLPALCTCEGLCLTVDDKSALDDVVDFILAFGEGKILNLKIGNRNISCLRRIKGSVNDGDVTMLVGCSKRSKNGQILLELSLTCPRPVINTINWRNVLKTFMKWTQEPEDYKHVITLLHVLHSASGLKKVHLQVEILSDEMVQAILSLIQTCPSLHELEIKVPLTFPQEVIEILQESLQHRDWTLDIGRKSVLLKRNRDGLSEEQKTEYLEENLASVSSSTLQAPKHTSIEVFTPELIDRDEAKGENTHRFVSPHAGQFQCSWTDLMFVMEGNGEMLYKIVSWDPRLLDGLGQMQPAGPLYSIDCFEGSISQLHLPHCEILSEENKDILAVAHFTGDNVEILQPLRVTSTHVIINITELSRFGLIKKIFSTSPIRSQVLLFLQPQRTTEKMLYVHLLPVNVPVSEVQSQHQEDRYIKTTSTCDLFPEKEYSLCCQPEEIEVQPEGEKFVCNFGPNYHPTFEVILHVDTVELKMGVLDSIDKSKVWRTRRIFLTVPDSNTNIADLRTATEFVDKHRAALIARVTSVMPITDCLRDKRMIPPEICSNINDASPNQAKMRLLFSVLDSGGRAVKAEFYRILKINESCLVQELESE